MTPAQKKAEELVNKFLNAEPKFNMAKVNAIECAIIAVNNTISVLNGLLTKPSEPATYKAIKDEYDFFEQVKQELIKMK